MMRRDDEQSADLAIIGGGAAGLAAAIFAAEAARAGAMQRRIVVLDGAGALGAKILVSGGGRCNVTHYKVLPQDFNGSQRIVRNILAAFDEAATVRWFTSLGVELKREPTGKLFPVSDSARTVLNALLRRCGELKIEIRTASRVSQLLAPGGTGDADFILGDNGNIFRIVDAAVISAKSPRRSDIWRQANRPAAPQKALRTLRSNQLPGARLCCAEGTSAMISSI
jgi:predicted flavoprotein YhiN